ncbi:unnamed protein product [Owenia fusiformis]|uniref:RING-type E3 ubiquitin transferase n=1 Tax=Owenia fusiformis TaxID=6347 RepID=A0A8J1TTP2_OWEFU|nr:unnamed protein product [Owenia fusiformis]
MQFTAIADENAVQRDNEHRLDSDDGQNYCLIVVSSGDNIKQSGDAHSDDKDITELPNCGVDSVIDSKSNKTEALSETCEPDCDCTNTVTTEEHDETYFHSPSSITSVASSTSTLSNGNICRICLSNDHETPMVSPCNCNGTVKFCHQECLLEWLSIKRSKECELCGTKFRVWNSGYKQFRQWVCPPLSGVDKTHLALFLVCVLTLFISLGWILWNVSNKSGSVYHSRIRTAAIITYSIYGPLDIISLVLIILEIKYTILPIFDAFRTLNSIMIIKNHTRFSEENISINKDGAWIDTEQFTICESEVLA